METTIYIVATENCYRMGLEPKVQLWEPESISRTWIRRLTVELPDGFEVCENYYGEPIISRNKEGYDLATNKDGNPVIIDHTANGKYIPLNVVSEGWG